MKRFFRKRLIATFLTVIAVPILQQIGVPQETIDWIIKLVMGYIGGQTVSDSLMAWKGTKTPATDEAGQ